MGTDTHRRELFLLASISARGGARGADGPKYAGAATATCTQDERGACKALAEYT